MSLQNHHALPHTLYTLHKLSGMHYLIPNGLIMRLSVKYIIINAFSMASCCSIHTKDNANALIADADDAIPAECGKVITTFNLSLT
jgi:hypothetical protein